MFFSQLGFQDAFFDVKPDKSMIPNTLNPSFYQRFWATCGDDVFTDCWIWLGPDVFL